MSRVIWYGPMRANHRVSRPPLRRLGERVVQLARSRSHPSVRITGERVQQALHLSFERRVVEVHAAKVAQLNHARDSFIKRGETRECLVKRDQVDRLVGRFGDGMVKRHPITRISFGREASPSVIDENLPHGLRRDAMEVTSLLAILDRPGGKSDTATEPWRDTSGPASADASCGRTAPLNWQVSAALFFCVQRSMEAYFAMSAHA